MVSDLIFAMTLAFGELKLGNVFQEKCGTLQIGVDTHFLHFVTALSIIAWMDGSKTIVQTEMKAVEAMIKKSISSVIVVKPAYKKVNSFAI